MEISELNMTEIARQTIKVFESGSADQYAEHAYKVAIELAREYLALSDRVDSLVDKIDELSDKFTFVKEMESNNE